jgi:hypothetical protein
MNYDLRTQAMDEDPLWSDMSQRMLNVMMKDTVIPIRNVYHTFIPHEDGTVIFEAKDRAYDPERTEEFLPTSWATSL